MSCYHVTELLNVENSMCIIRVSKSIFFSKYLSGIPLVRLAPLFSTNVRKMSLPPRKLIIDCDTGTDDAQAIMMALAQPDVQVIAVTTVFGNTSIDNSSINTLRVLKFKGRQDIPVYRGCERSMLGVLRKATYHGEDGLGDIKIEGIDPVSASELQTEHAVQALVRIVNENPNEITLVATGPLTNVAMALHLDPAFGQKLKDISIMGGNSTAKGNVTPCAEFNFHADPEAAYFVLGHLGRKITLAVLEMCEEHGFSWEWYEKFTNENNRTSSLIRDFERGTVTREHAAGKPHYIMVWDQVAMATAINNQVVTESEDVYATVEIQGEHTRGQVVIDWRGKMGKSPNVRLVTKLDRSLFGKLMYSSFKD